MSGEMVLYNKVTNKKNLIPNFGPHNLEFDFLQLRLIEGSVSGEMVV